MVYLCTDLIAALGAVVQTTRVGTAWSKISGLQAGVSVPGSGPGDRGFKSHPPHHTSKPGGSLRSLSLEVGGRGDLRCCPAIVLPRSAFIDRGATEHEVDS